MRVGGFAVVRLGGGCTGDRVGKKRERDAAVDAKVIRRWPLGDTERERETPPPPSCLFSCLCSSTCAFIAFSSFFLPLFFRSLSSSKISVFFSFRFALSPVCPPVRSLLDSKVVVVAAAHVVVPLSIPAGLIGVFCPRQDHRTSKDEEKNSRRRIQSLMLSTSSSLDTDRSTMVHPNDEKEKGAPERDFIVRSSNPPD